MGKDRLEADQDGQPIREYAQEEARQWQQNGPAAGFQVREREELDHATEEAKGSPAVLDEAKLSRTQLHEEVVQQVLILRHSCDNHAIVVYAYPLVAEELGELLPELGEAVLDFLHGGLRELLAHGGRQPPLNAREVPLADAFDRRAHDAVDPRPQQRDELVRGHRGEPVADPQEVRTRASISSLRHLMRLPRHHTLPSNAEAGILVLPDA
mmetsp:Transcript_45320/g.116371  ORF Transcript_45320/g.116371 Transcript_45320/m.116371 type:complete len:211 (+) Transcript_45320:577-1209(+)